MSDSPEPPEDRHEASPEPDTASDSGPDPEADPGADPEAVSRSTPGPAGSTRPDNPPDPADPADPAAAGDADVGDGADSTGYTDAAESDDPVPHRRQHPRLAGLLIGVLCLLLGFALAVQVRTASSDQGLESARQEDLVSILDDLESGEDRMHDEISDLEDTRDELASGGDQTQAALEEAQDRGEELSILAGTVPVQGPGIVVTIADPDGQVGPVVMLDVIQELRAAGAEAMQVGDVRIGVTSAVTGEAGAITVDGTVLGPPYTVLAVGDPPTLTAALNIPGGVVATVDHAGGTATMEPSEQVVIDAVRPVDPPEHAEPAPPED